MNGKQRILEILDALDGCGIIVDDLELVEQTLDELDVKNEFASVVWTAEDVIVHAKRKGTTLTEGEAEECLDNNEGYIENAMIDAGWEALSTCFDIEFSVTDERVG
jgi:hypothetical protein